MKYEILMFWRLISTQKRNVEKKPFLTQLFHDADMPLNGPRCRRHQNLLQRKELARGRNMQTI